MSDKVLKIMPYAGKQVNLAEWWAGAQAGDPSLAGFGPEVAIDAHRANNRVDAQRYISAQHKLAEPPMAVSFFVEEVMTPEAKKLQRRLDNHGRRYKTLIANALKSIKKAKSPRVACRVCRSLMNRKYIETSECPVCKALLLTTKNRERVEALEQAMAALKEEIQTHPMIPNKTGPIAWLIGGWVVAERPV